MQNNLKFNILETSQWSSLEHKDYGELKTLKKMQARRMTPLAKKAIDIVLSMDTSGDVDFIVYSSRHGELLLSYDLIQSIHEKEALSPIKFSQSTHNSTAGQLCILGKLKVPSTAISAGEESFSMGMLSCVNYLADKPRSRVLYLFADAKLPRVYEKKINEIQEETIVAMTIENGQDYSVSITHNNSNSKEAQSLQFLNWLASNKKELSWDNLILKRETL